MPLVRTVKNCILALTLCPSLFAAVPLALEADFADATLAYQEKKYEPALKILDRLLREAPSQKEFLELKALVLASKKSLSEAGHLYERLIQQSKDRKDTGLYRFELGRIRYQQRRSEEALKWFLESIELKTNLHASLFFIGVMAFERRKFDVARTYFHEVLTSSSAELKASARIYLAQISMGLSDAGGAARHFTAARGLTSQPAPTASPVPVSEVSRETLAAINRGLARFDKTLWFASLGFLTGYDSNVLSVPTGTGSETGLGTSSLVQVLNCGLTYATSPTRPWQFATHYRANLNYNFNVETRAGQFFTHDLTAYLTEEPLSLSHWGFKAQAIGSLQYVDKLKFSAFSVIGSVGPFKRWSLGPNWVLGTELFFQPQKFYFGAGTALSRSGWQVVGRTYVTRGEPREYWNPGVSLTGDYNHTSGADFRSYRVGLDLGNTVYLSNRLSAGLGLGVGVASYPARSEGKRLDQTGSVTYTASLQLGQGFSVIGTVQYLRNFSNVPDFRYARFVGSGGLHYVF